MVLKSKGRFAAFEVKSEETLHQAIGNLMRLARAKNILFGALEVYNTFTVGQLRFVRIRSDLDLKPIKEDILKAGRGVIVRSDSGVPYEVSLSDGSKGKHSASAMHATPRVTEHRSYRGTRDKFWERQFEL